MDREIVYLVRQSTNAPDHKMDGVIERFKRELELQFGRTIKVTVMERPNVDRSRVR